MTSIRSERSKRLSAGQICGLDVGCGANLIYCLLGAKEYAWKMVGLDISKEAEAGARANLEANPGLSNLIKLCIRDPALHDHKGMFVEKL